ncbi:hypothetical protein LTS08_000281 [Lithohypha guttulata]|uniref:uncharacterized protein n=1 Tax=Lithohypha guttulata TaxID=1690604 RepID=UPI002DDFE092|nr:hypothetical protein LTR51_007098 [Lithohypha guttulata]KAK5106164.1 hypothetical protein LTS08_000281 [Lithohypha guttulata]
MAGEFWRQSRFSNKGINSAVKTVDFVDIAMSEDQHVTHIKPTYHVTVSEAPKFDLQSYIANYKGRTVFRRLYLIASCSTALQEEAARLAVAEAKKGSDVNQYQDAVQLLATITGQNVQELMDKKWLSNQEKQNAAESKRLENELKQYKNNLIRESIRMGSEELGVHNHSTGDLPNALKSFNRMRDYCTGPGHIATTAFRTIAVNIEQRNWLGVQSQVAKIRALQQMKPEESAKNQPKIFAAQGLQYMSLGDYKEAANFFLDVDFAALGDNYNDVISANDVAVYGGLCALASMSRSELQNKVLDNANFRSFLELEPHIRRAINSFCASKYSQCLETLESYRVDYLLDIYLQEQLGLIYTKIRTKSIVQYFQPFSRVTLKSMEKMFGTSSTSTTNGQQSSTGTITPFVQELIQMIESDALQARIDLERMVLIAYEESPRAVMQQQALDTVDNFINEARIKLLRLNAINGGLEVKQAQNKGKQTASGAMDISSLVDVSSGSGQFQGQGYSLRSARG